jgi:hypothetical protein
MEKFKSTNIEVSYTAYIKTDKEEGFIQLKYSQCENLLFLSKNLNDATFFNSKVEIYKELVSNKFKCKSIEFYKKTVSVQTCISKENYFRT